MSQKAIEATVRTSLETYLNDLQDTAPAELYDMIVRTLEKPMLEVVMARAGQNQSKAAEWLGLNRNTLRKKLLDHKLAE
jgi:Fis family transcriptional regulator, factor for inversion stimulation protein